MGYFDCARVQRDRRDFAVKRDCTRSSASHSASVFFHAQTHFTQQKPDPVEGRVVEVIEKSAFTNIVEAITTSCTFSFFTDPLGERFLVV